MIVGGLGLWGLLIFSKNRAKRINDKKMLMVVKNIENKFKNIIKSLVGCILNFIKMLLCIVLAIGSKNVIYVLNQPLGEGYAIFVSYLVAICLYILLPDFNKNVKNKKTNSN